ncbi:hypothetical protein J2S74_004622 [Evansella vedderi]|uniref:DUF2262 domain-containing protein n=2 Tax=Evansella vedderi TaxID=38282 RepID=A0ABU0A109_9BACI|nr:hypothetical protein [Evansella vedderi]
MFEVEAVEGEDDELEEDTTMNPVEKYNVFADFELYHTYGLAEERMFYHSIATGYVLGSGHLGHAVGHFDLFEINEAGDEVTLIRKMNEDTHYDAVQEVRGTDDWEEKIIQYMLESVEAVEELFFKYTEGVEETEISFDGQTFTVYPVEMDGRIHYFKEGEGLWMKYYNDQATIEFHGEAQQATRILNR